MRPRDDELTPAENTANANLIEKPINFIHNYKIKVKIICLNRHPLSRNRDTNTMNQAKPMANIFPLCTTAAASIRRWATIFTAFSILLVVSNSYAVDVILGWDPNNEPDLAGYKLYGSEGVPGPPYDHISTYLISDFIANNPSVMMTEMAAGIPYYFVVTAYDTAHNESGYSNWICVMNGQPCPKSILIEDFVIRLYQKSLDRDPDPSGLEEWTNDLLNQIKTGAEVAKGFIFSQEFVDKSTTQEEYLNILYSVFYDREPDPAGFQEWLNALQNGLSREEVFEEFIYDQEFADLCWIYGVSANPVAAFIVRLYNLCLDRDPDKAGLDGWTNDLIKQIKTGAEVAWGFIFSQEFTDRSTTNDEYLTILYKAFFDRLPDQPGWDYWIAELNSGKDRGDVLNGFVYSQEFKMLCENYGITAY